MADQEQALQAMQESLRFISAADLFREIPEAGEDMASRPENGQGAMEFVDALLQGMTPEEALTFIAHILNPRQAVWWGHECLRLLTESLSDQDRNMLRLASEWVGAQDEDTRVEALSGAMNADAKTPGVWVAFGAAWSSGSMTPPDQAEVPVPTFLTGRAINAGVLSALARVAQTDRGTRLMEFANMGKILATSH